MVEQSIPFAIEAYLARRLIARAADLGVDLADVIQDELLAWLGSWGLSVTTHIVRPGDTLTNLSVRYYGDATKTAVIAAFNDLQDSDSLALGSTLRIPEVRTEQPLARGESPYIFGLHDRGGEFYMGWAGRRGWVLCTEAIGAGSGDWSSKSYQDLYDHGYGVIVRLNNGYHEGGTLPVQSRYADFARRCGNFVERSAGCHIWIIGNEPNLAVERPGGPHHGEVITPQMYATAFRACREAIRSRSGHDKDQVVVGAVGPWNIQTQYPGNPGGDWIVYFQHVLEALDGGLDGIALHTYGRDAEPGSIVSELHMDPPYDHRRKMFRTYIDYMEAIPQVLRHLPVYITETDQNIAWVDANRGWTQEAYAEIDRWNGDGSHQRIRCLLLYRWETHQGDIWGIRGKDGVIDDFRAALQHEYKWHG